MKTKNEIIYTTQQVADMLGYSSDSIIRQMIERGTIEAEKFSFVWMITESEVDRLKNEGYGGNKGIDNNTE